VRRIGEEPLISSKELQDWIGFRSVFVNLLIIDVGE